jgi:hypothetical protein
MTHNKLPTIDNLVKRQSVDILTCVFCDELESCQHIFFECVVSSNMWSEMKRILGFNFPSATIVDISILWKNKKNMF